jgi:MFS family permease
LPGRPSRQLAPLRVAGFRLLFLSTLGSSIGTFLASVALTIDVKDRTDSGLWVGAVLVVEIVPVVIVGLTLGPLLDRLRRRDLMVAADVLRVIVFCLLPFASSAGEIVVLALVTGLATGFFRPAVYAGVPNLFTEEELPDANALLQTVENVSWAAGPVLGGVLAAAEGPHAAYWINAGSFVVSAVLVARIPAHLLQSGTALSRGHWTDLRDGFSAALRSRPVLAVLLGWGIASIGSGGITVSEVFFAKNTLHAGDFGYGLLYSGIGAGLVVGGFFSSRVVERLGLARAYGANLLCMGVGFGVAAVSTDVWMAAALCVVGGVGNGGAVVCNALLVQRGMRDDLRGRALTFVMSATYGVWGISLIVGGAAMPPDAARWVWGAGAACIAVAAFVGYAAAREPAAVTSPASVSAG